MSVLSSGLLYIYALSLLSSIAATGISLSLVVLVALVGAFSHQVSWRHPLEGPVGLFLGAILINLLFTPSLIALGDRLEELIWIVNLWGVTKVLELAWSEKFERRFINVLFFGVGLISLYGAIQFFTGIDIVRGNPPHMVAHGGVYRAAGFFSNALTYSNVLGVVGLAITLPLFRRNKWLGAAVAFFTVVGILASQSRGSWLGYGISALILLYAIRKSLTRAQIGGLIALGLAPLIVLLNTKGFSERLYRMLSLKMDESVSIRFDLWKAHWQMFLDHPIFGVGFQQARGLLLEYYEKLSLNQTFVSHAHNDYIQALAETGLIGFFAFVILIFWTMKKTLALKAEYREWALSLFAAQVFVFLGSLTQANFTDAEVNHCLILNWALVSVLTIRSQQAART